MSKEILLKTFKEHIKGYGLTSDMLHLTHHGIPLEEAEKYETIWEVFIEDFDLEPYRLDIADVEKRSIPRGTLYIYGELKEPITDDNVAEALGWTKTYEPHSQQWKSVPYWDKDGAYMSAAWEDIFVPTTCPIDAMQALEHLIDAEKITDKEVCKLICEFIIDRNKKGKYNG